MRALSDFDAWERGAMRRGAEVERTDALARPGPGMAWAATFPYRGKRREIEVRLDDVVAPGSAGVFRWQGQPATARSPST